MIYFKILLYSYRTMEISTRENSIRDQLNNILSKSNVTELPPKAVSIFYQLSEFCLSTEICSSTLE